jgi:putative component of toxin-antitoxin plasmid stabilization module
MQTVDVSKNNTIVLGRANEYGDHDTVVFDISSIRKSVGDGEVALYYKRRGGEAIYIPSGVRVDGDTVVWVPSEIDLGVESKSGECEILYAYGNGRYISKTFGVIVLKSMVSDSDLTPEYEDMYDSWLKEIQKYVSAITTAKAIDSVEIGRDYELIINYIDGSSFVTPSLKGPKGDTGPQGI